MSRLDEGVGSEKSFDLGAHPSTQRGDDALVLDGLTHRRIGNLVAARLFAEEPTTLRVGRFIVLNRIGQGGMGTVYAAYDEQLDRKVAVKVIANRTKTNETASLRLQREAQAMARLSHPNVVTVHEVGETDGEVFVAMEFIRGQSLDAWIKAKPDWREVLEVFLQAGRGLVAAHEAGLVHRDLKPHNIMRGEDGTVKVLDFGLARAEGGDATTERQQVSGLEDSDSALDAELTKTGAVLGTPAYMSPEQHRGWTTDARSDQYSFCVALFEALYGTRPFVAPTMAGLVMSVLSHDLQPPPSESRVPAWVHRVVVRGLSLQPEDRWPSMEALLQALGRDPARKNRRSLMIAGLGVVAGLVGFSMSQLGESCPAATEEVEAIWSAERRVGVRDSFMASGSLLAEDTFTRIEDRVAAYAKDLAKMRFDACEMHRRRQQSARLYDLRIACLDARRAGLDELITEFGSADHGTVANAAWAVASLPGVSACGDTEALTSAVPPPEDPQVAREVQVHREVLASARALMLAGDYEEATARTRSTLDAAASLGYEPLLAEAELTHGTALMESHQHESAQEALSRGITVALHSGHDEVVVEALARRMWVVADPLRRPEDALGDDLFAEPLIDKLGRPMHLQWLLLNNRAVVHFRGGRLREAETSYREALELLESEGEQGYPVELISTRFNLGMLLLLGLGRAGDAAAEFRSARAQAVELLGPEHPRVAVFSAELASSLASAGRFAEAQREIEQGLARESSAPFLRAQLLVEKAMVNMTTRHYDVALESAQEALVLSEAEFPGEFMHSAALWYRGQARIGSGRTDEGIEDLRVAIAQQVEQVGPDHEFVGEARWRAGQGFLEAGLLDEARIQVEKARKIFLSLGPSAPSYMARQGYLFVEVYLAQGRLSEAEAAIEECMEAQDQLGFESTNKFRANLVRLQAELMVARGQEVDARLAYASACDALALDAEDEDPELAECRWAYAQALEDGPEARDLATQALAAFGTLGPGFASHRRQIKSYLRGRP